MSTHVFGHEPRHRAKSNEHKTFATTLRVGPKRPIDGTSAPWPTVRLGRANARYVDVHPAGDAPIGARGRPRSRSPDASTIRSRRSAAPIHTADIDCLLLLEWRDPITIDLLRSRRLVRPLVARRPHAASFPGRALACLEFRRSMEHRWYGKDGSGMAGRPAGLGGCSSRGRTRMPILRVRYRHPSSGFGPYSRFETGEGAIFDLDFA